MSDFISSTISNMLSNGIALNLESKEEEEYYIIKMQEYFVTETEFPAYLRGNNILEIENSDMQIAMEILIQQSTLYMLPYSQDVFVVFTEVLKFIANKHETIMKEFRGNEETKIQAISEVNKLDETEENFEEEEPSSDDDFEWI